MRILIVDDDVNKAEQLSACVRSWRAGNVEIEVRHWFESGLKEAIQSRWNVVLLDMTMPTYDVGPPSQEVKIVDMQVARS